MKINCIAIEDEPLALKKINEFITNNPTLDTGDKAILEGLKNDAETNLNKDEVIAKVAEIKDKLTELTDKETLKSNKEKAKTKIEALTDLNDAQKAALKDEVENATDETMVNNVVDKANELDNAMTELKSEITKLENLIKNPNIKLTDKTKLEDLKNKIDSKKDTNLTKVEVEGLTKEIQDLLKIVKIDLKKYTKYADAFYYTDTTIADRVNENTFFDVNFSKSLVNVLQDIVDGKKLDGANIIGGIQLGGNYEVKKDLVLGGFAEYQNKVAHNIALGMNVKYKDFLGFTRYRIALKDSKVNHNIDVYARYSKVFNFDKVELEPKVALYLTYSSKVKLDENVELKARVGVLGETALLVAYNIDRAKIYVEPKLAFGYNNQNIVQTNVKDNEHKIVRSYVDYSLRLGAKYKFANNVSIDGDINIKGDMNRNIKMGARIGAAYSW